MYKNARKKSKKALPELQYVSVKKRAKMRKELYKARTGSDLNLRNPRKFTEELQWIKLYYCHPDMQRCVDKIEFKNYIKEKLGDGYTAPIIKIWNNPSEVSIKDIPVDKFVIKSTLQSDGNFIVLVSDKSKIDILKVEKEIKEKWFDTRYLLTNSFCSAYYGAKPRVVVEEYIEEFANACNDYKLFCFHGVPSFFYVAEDHFHSNGELAVSRITFYDLNWKPMDVKYGKHETDPHVNRPHHIEEMIKIASELSKPFPFVRVDFFDTETKLYLAELTFYPGGVSLLIILRDLIIVWVKCYSYQRSISKTLMNGYHQNL